MDNVPGLMNQFSVALGSYSSQQLSAYMQFTEAREKLKDYENQLEDAKQLYRVIVLSQYHLKWKKCFLRISITEKNPSVVV